MLKKTGVDKTVPKMTGAAVKKEGDQTKNVLNCYICYNALTLVLNCHNSVPITLIMSFIKLIRLVTSGDFLFPDFKISLQDVSNHTMNDNSRI